MIWKSTVGLPVQVSALRITVELLKHIECFENIINLNSGIFRYKTICIISINILHYMNSHEETVAQFVFISTCSHNSISLNNNREHQDTRAPHHPPTQLIGAQASSYNNTNASGCICRCETQIPVIIIVRPLGAVVCRNAQLSIIIVKPRAVSLYVRYTSVAVSTPDLSLYKLMNMQPL